MCVWVKHMTNNMNQQYWWGYTLVLWGIKWYKLRIHKPGAQLLKTITIALGRCTTTQKARGQNYTVSIDGGMTFDVLQSFFNVWAKLGQYRWIGSCGFEWPCVEQSLTYHQQSTSRVNSTSMDRFSIFRTTWTVTTSDITSWKVTQSQGMWWVQTALI